MPDCRWSGWTDIANVVTWQTLALRSVQLSSMPIISLFATASRHVSFKLFFFRAIHSLCFHGLCLNSLGLVIRCFDVSNIIRTYALSALASFGFASLIFTTCFVMANHLPQSGVNFILNLMKLYVRGVFSLAHACLSP